MSVEEKQIQEMIPLEAPLLVLAPGVEISPLIKVSALVANFSNIAANVQAQCDRANITNTADYQDGSELLTYIQKQSRDIEELRISIKKPVDEYAKMIQGVFAPPKSAFELCKAVLSAKMLNWRNAEEKKQREKEAAERKAREDEALAIAASAEQRGDVEGANAVVDLVSKSTFKRSAIQGIAGGQSKRTYWKGSAHDPMAILRNIVAGNLPLDLVEFRLSAMNSIAESKKTEGLHLGIKISKDEKLV